MTKTGFEGRYHHVLSRPSELGQTLYKWCNDVGAERATTMLLDEHPSGWINITASNPRAEVGFNKKEVFEAQCAVCGNPYWKHYQATASAMGEGEKENQDNPLGVAGLLADHIPLLEAFENPQCFCHGEQSSDAAIVLTDKNAALVGCEYVYVFDERKLDEFIILVIQDILNPKNPTWKYAATVRLNEPEPDWILLDVLARDRGWGIPWSHLEKGES